MNELIDTFFGDNFISLECDSGECLHYSQVPGYVVCASFFGFYPEAKLLLLCISAHLNQITHGGLP